VAIEGLTGTTAYLQARNISNQAALHPAVEIINLGTNDANLIGVDSWATSGGVRFLLEPAQTVASVNASFDSFISEFAAVSPETCLIFVNVNTHNPGWHPENAQALNQHLAAVAPHLVDWDAAWRPEYFGSPPDPHPNELGRQALLALEDQAIAGCVPPEVPEG
jgi:hypothetical protein